MEEERPLRPLPVGWIRVQMVHVGICGTDLHLLETTEDGYTRCSCPAHIPAAGRVLGHEGVGRVCAVSSGVERLVPGDVACLESIITCTTCEKCRQGAFNQCERSRLLGMEEDGLFSEYADVPASLAHCVNDIACTARDLEGLACVEPAAVAMLACTNAGISPGERVAVFGAGPIGFYVALMARTLFGAVRVCLSEPVELRRELGRRAADRVVRPEEFADDDETYDVLVDAAGHLEGVSATIPRMKGNGRIVLLARTGQPFTTDGVDHVISKSLRIMGSRGHLGGAVEAVLELARSGRLDLRAPVTSVVDGLDGLAEMLRSPDACLTTNCKTLARLSAGAEVRR